MAQLLKSIRIEGYKSIGDQTVELRDVNILIGPNGAGKSNFIGVFRFLRQIVERRLQITIREAGGGERLLYFGSKQTIKINFTLDFNPNYYHLSLASSNNDSLFVLQEQCGFQGVSDARPYWENISEGTAESNLLDTTRRTPVVDHTYNALKTWRVYHFHDTSSGAAVKKRANINDNSFLREDAANLAAFLYKMRQVETKYYQRIVKSVQMVIPNFRDFHLRPDPLNEGTVLLEWESSESDYLFGVSELSDGSLRFICLVTVLLQPAPPSIILLDEPELGLHPAAITLLAGMLRKVAHKSQIIISTQSAALVSQFEPEDILVVELENKSTVFKRLNSQGLEGWLEDYTLGELWNKNLIGGRP